MSSAVFALVVNASLAIVVALAFAALQRHMDLGSWRQSFAGSYLVGTLTPLSELAIRYEVAVPVFMAISYLSFLGAFLLFASALARYYAVRISSFGLVGLFASGALVRAILWGGERDDLLYEICYQAPFAAALATSAFVLWRSGKRLKAEIALLFVLVVTSGHFIGKAFAASIVGSGADATAYHSSQYALISQSATAVLLVSVALSTMAVIIRDALEKASAAAMTDELSGLLNRRGFDARASTMLRSGTPHTALVLDLDHFKSVNDEFGHAIGDEVIRCLSRVARDIAPLGGILARTGGEEFSILLPLEMDASARFAEKLRVAQKDASSR